MNSFLSCERAKKLISPYFDKELPEEEKNLLENHFQQCSSCKQELEKLKQLSLIIKTSYQVNIENYAAKQFESEAFSSDKTINDVKQRQSFQRLQKKGDDHHQQFFEKGLLPKEIENCLRVKSDISAFIDGELEKENMIETLEHIINCDFCRKQYEKTKKTRELIKNYLRRPVYEDNLLQNRRTCFVVIEKLKTLKHKKKIIASTAAAVVVAALLIQFSFDLQNPESIDDLNIDNTRLIRTDKPIYVQSEDFFITELYSKPPEEIVSLLYGE